MEEKIKKLVNLSILQDRHIENQLEEIEEITVEDELLDEWEDDGKYQYGSMNYLITYKGKQYVIFCSQMRSGSYHTDYYYQDATCQDVITFEEYKKPKKVFEILFKNNIIEIYEDKTAKINDIKYITVEEAILSLT